MTESVTGQDLRAMVDLINVGYEDEPTDGLPCAVLDGLRQLAGAVRLDLLLRAAPATSALRRPGLRA